jgi:hypothetical protein
MKINNETLLLISWLKKIKGCQITQQNWNATHSGKLQNEEIIDETIHSVKNFYLERFKYLILSNVNSHKELLQHCSIEVLGFEINSTSVTNCYGINTTFDEKNHANDNSLELTISNLVRTAMGIYAYYNLSKATIIFATPYINQSSQIHLSDAVKALNEIFKLFGFEFSFLLYINQDFTVNIVNPLSKLVDNEYYTPQSETASWKTRKFGLSNKKNQNKFTANNKQVEISVLVQTEFENFSKNNMISENMLQNLLDNVYSKETFGINFPVLKKVMKDSSIIEQRRRNGFVRYWNKVYTINGGEYLICNDWYEKYRTKFLIWAEELKDSKRD